MPDQDKSSGLTQKSVKLKLANGEKNEKISPVFSYRCHIAHSNLGLWSKRKALGPRAAHDRSEYGDGNPRKAV